LQVWVKDCVLLRAEIDEEETEQARARIAGKLEELRRGDYLKGQ